jgi:hypothetical protein
MADRREPSKHCFRWLCAQRVDLSAADVAPSAPPADCTPHHTAQPGYNQALDQYLTEYPAATGPEGRSQSHLAALSLRTHQEEVCHVRTAISSTSAKARGAIDPTRYSAE